MVIVFASSAVHHGVEPQSGQTKDYNIGINCFSTKHAALISTSKVTWNQNNVRLEQHVYQRAVVS